jgi:hypothetical protein
MYAQVEKQKENKNRAVANSIDQKKGNEKQGFGIVDNRPEAATQRKLQEMANNSSQDKQTAQFLAIAKSNSAQERQFVQKKENHMGLPGKLISGVENLSGYSMDDVKVHNNSHKPTQLQAHAYAQGTDIHLGLGQEKHLPHDACHVVQQKPVHSALHEPMEPIQRFIINADVVDAATLEQNVGEALERGEDWAEAPHLLNTEPNRAKGIALFDAPLMGGYAAIADNPEKQAWVERMLNRIEQGAIDTAEDAQHWREQMQAVPDLNDVEVTAIILTDADMHERGLGVAFLDVKWNRTLTMSERSSVVSVGMNPTTTKEERRRFVLKPGDRTFEQRLLGRGVNSVAEQLNTEANLGENSVETIRMRATPDHGTLVEFVEENLGSYLASWRRWLLRDDQPVVETIAFSLLTGLWDLHHQNVMSRGGKPVLIDAEVGAMPHVHARQHDTGLTPQETGVMRNEGFSNAAHEKVDAQIDGNNQQSALITWAQGHNAQLRAILNNTIGDAWSRVVPVFTADLAGLKNNFLRGHLNNRALQRDQALDDAVNSLLGTAPNASPGLAFMLGADQGQWDQNRAREGIRQDFLDGTLPEFSYQPQTGLVRSRNGVIWEGTTLNDSITVLLGRL